MDDFETGWQLLAEKFGGGKDNIIALATVALEPGASGAPRPVARAVDALYEDGVFYLVTNRTSNKVRQIERNAEVSVATMGEMFTASGRAENRGWVLDPANAALRAKLRAAFAAWYDQANDEQDRNCCFVAIRLARGTLNVNHWEKLYHLDFERRAAMPDGGVR